ncbi:glycosyltransferase family 39 protein [bacterium]|nr:glycosyltransferase family 39 protein [bacterium]
MINDKLKNYIYYAIIIAILLTGFLLRLKGYITNPSFWHDESALGWNILNKSYTELFEKLRFLQIAPPMFLILSKLLVTVTDSYNHVFRCDIVLRTIPFLCGNLSLIMFYFVAKKLFNSKWAILAGLFLIALNPVLINYSFEFKPYSADVLCSLIALYIFLSIDFKNTSQKQILQYSAILAVLPWLSFGSAFVILAGIMAISFKKENPKMFIYLLSPVFASALLYWHVFVANSYAQNSKGMIGFWGNAFVNKDLSNLVQLNQDNLQYFFMKIPDISFALITVCMLSGLILFIRHKKYMFVMLSALTFSVLVLASMSKFYPFSQRMILFLMPFVFIFTAKITDSKNWWLGWIVFAFLAMPHFKFVQEFCSIKTLNKGDYSRILMHKMSQEIQPDEIIIFNGASNTDYFYYNMFFKLKNKVEQIKPQTEDKTEAEQMLNCLPKGKYWFFMPTDYKHNSVNVNNIKNWIENNKNASITFEAHTTQSTLIRLTLD